MKLMNELLGFAVLTSPLWLILFLLPVSIWIAVKFKNRFKSGGARYASGFGAFALVFLLPFLDGIVGHLYFSVLCVTLADVHVDKTIVVPAEYWDEQGQLKLRDEDGRFRLPAPYSIKYKTGAYSSFFHVDHSGYSLVDTRSGESIGEVTDFRFWGGVIRRNLSPHNTADSCGNSRERFDRLIAQAFVQK